MGPMKLQPSHWVAIGGQIVSLGTLVAGLQHGWRDAVTPTFISAVIMQIGTLLIALNGDSVTNRRAQVWPADKREALRAAAQRDAPPDDSLF